MQLVGVGFQRRLREDVRQLGLLLVLIEALDLAQELRGHLIQGRHLVRSDRDLDIREVADDWLEFGVVNSEKGLDYL